METKQFFAGFSATFHFFFFFLEVRRLRSEIPFILFHVSKSWFSLSECITKPVLWNGISVWGNFSFLGWSRYKGVITNIVDTQPQGCSTPSCHCFPTVLAHSTYLLLIFCPLILPYTSERLLLNHERCQDSWPPEENSIRGQRWGLITQSFCVIEFY